MRIYETTDICFNEIYCWCGDVWSIDICACWHDVLVAWVADDGHTFRTYAGDGRSDANLCSRPTRQTHKKQGGTHRTEGRSGFVGTHFHRLIRRGWTESPIWMDYTSYSYPLHSIYLISNRICYLCRGDARKPMALSYYRGAGWSVGCIHRTLRHRAPPYVHCHHIDVSRHASCAWLAHSIRHHATLHPHHHTPHQRRRATPQNRTQRLHRILHTSALAIDTFYILNFKRQKNRRT